MKTIKFPQVRKSRKKKKYTAKYMSDKLKKMGFKISVSTYYGKEKGTIPVTTDEVIAICEILQEKVYIFFSK